jgi:hypothetical protein
LAIFSDFANQQSGLIGGNVSEKFCPAQANAFARMARAPRSSCAANRPGVMLQHVEYSTNIDFHANMTLGQRAKRYSSGQVPKIQEATSNIFDLLIVVHSHHGADLSRQAPTPLEPAQVAMCTPLELRRVVQHVGLQAAAVVSE